MLKPLNITMVPRINYKTEDTRLHTKDETSAKFEINGF